MSRKNADGEEPRRDRTDDDRATDESTRASGGINRRTALSVLGVGGLGLAAGSAAAREPGRGTQPFYDWGADIDANGYLIADLGSLSMSDNPTAITDFAGDNLAIDDDGVLNAEEPKLRYVHAADWDDRLQDEIDAAAANEERHLVVHGAGVFEPATTVYLPDDFTLKIDDNVRLVPPPDHDLDEIPTGNRIYRALITNANHEDGNENVAVEGGYVSFENVEWEEMSHAPVWFHNCVSPRQEGVTVENVLYDYGSAGDTRQFGVYLSECEGGVQRDCVARRVGYDGIGNRGYGPNRTGKIIGCEAYDIPGTGIQFAGDVRNQDTPSDAPFLESFVVRDCETDAYITVHSGGDGASNGIVENNEARYISLIGDAAVDNVELINNITGGVLLSPRDEMTNIRIHGHDFRSGSGSSIRLYGYSFAPDTHLDTLTISGCFSRDDALLSTGDVGYEDAVYENVRLIDNVHDPEDTEDAAFFDGSGESDVEALDVIGNTVHAPTAIDGGADTVRLQDNALDGVDEVATDDVARALQNGRGTNAGDPSTEGEWNGHADFAEESNALIHDTENDDWYRAVDDEWVPV